MKSKRTIQTRGPKRKILTDPNPCPQCAVVIQEARTQMARERRISKAARETCDAKDAQIKKLDSELYALKQKNGQTALQETLFTVANAPRAASELAKLGAYQLRVLGAATGLFTAVDEVLQTEKMRAWHALTHPARVELICNSLREYDEQNNNHISTVLVALLPLLSADANVQQLRLLLKSPTTRTALSTFLDDLQRHQKNST